MSNDLIQHPEMSAVARILGIYIQSLPNGTPIGIKDLVRRLPLGETAIAKGLRELVLFGYLERSLENLPGGRIVTHTVSHNHPRAAAAVASPRGGSGPEGPVEPEPEEQVAPEAVAEPAEAVEPPVAVSPPVVVLPVPAADASVAVPPDGPRAPGPREEPQPQPAPVASRLPVPREPDDPWRRRVARDVLVGLRRIEPRLLLGERDIRYLVGGVEAWLERGADADAVVAVLVATPPSPLRNPAGLIAHRLAAQLPPPLAPLPRAPAFVQPDPLQNCDKCDRAFRAPAPGRCKECVSGCEAPS
ncbi:helix-turn-helix domain-containing protein [Streptomyces sp. H34-S4]|uniref:helix-turn-helix domain-containing protein n=1 Tax=Streptomyces sp. H34-S4 TaxID=2996463 RepID=UPI0022702B31|nr:helix-turn-helix domain-containing protein [Streptomyces sp. H34-S4]MCY0937726.1 helix-turn-helix domain-containing protein [Streptomyces sp. H34-S4]